MELHSRGIEFEDCQDIEKITSLGISHVPVMSINGQLFDFKSAIAWLKGRGK